jgi:DNA-binding IclR family transcriptional regulator
MTMQAYGTAILKAVKILDFLSSRHEPQSLSEISVGTGLNKATAYKLLETLQMVRYVEKNKDAGYRLGIGLAKLAYSSLQSLDIVQVATPFLEVLNEQTGETVHLGVLDRDEVVYVSKLESKQAVRMYSKVGNASPLYCTGIGKAILSTFSEERLSQYLDGRTFHRFTDSTITTAEGLRNEVNKIRQMGYSVDNCEHERDVRCIAVPLYRDNRLYGAMSVSAPSYRMTDDTLTKYLSLLKQCQHEILERLKFFA